MAKIMRIQPSGSKGDPRNGHGQSGWSPIGALSVVKVSQKFEHPKSTPYVAFVGSSCVVAVNHPLANPYWMGPPR